MLCLLRALLLPALYRCSLPLIDWLMSPSALLPTLLYDCIYRLSAIHPWNAWLTYSWLYSAYALPFSSGISMFTQSSIAPANTLSAITPPGAVQPPEDRTRNPVDGPLVDGFGSLSLGPKPAM
jgi:hypothetical protein